MDVFHGMQYYNPQFSTSVSHDDDEIPITDSFLPGNHLVGVGSSTTSDVTHESRYPNINGTKPLDLSSQTTHFSEGPRFPQARKKTGASSSALDDSALRVINAWLSSYPTIYPNKKHIRALATLTEKPYKTIEAWFGARMRAGQISHEDSGYKSNSTCQMSSIGSTEAFQAVWNENTDRAVAERFDPIPIQDDINPTTISETNICGTIACAANFILPSENFLDRQDWNNSSFILATPQHPSANFSGPENPSALADINSQVSNPPLLASRPNTSVSAASPTGFDRVHSDAAIRKLALAEAALVSVDRSDDPRNSCKEVLDKSCLRRVEGRPYQCTRCGKGFDRKDSWKKHEEISYPQGGWLCMLGHEVVVNGLPQCSYCCTNNPDLQHLTTQHKDRVQQFRDRKYPFCNKIYYRRQHIVQHFNLIHQNPSIQFSHYEKESYFRIANSNFPRQCGFCAHQFTSWSERIDHVANHFTQEELDISQWDSSKWSSSKKKPYRSSCSNRFLGSPYDGDSDSHSEDDDHHNGPGHRPFKRQRPMHSQIVPGNARSSRGSIPSTNNATGNSSTHQRDPHASQLIVSATTSPTQTHKCMPGKSDVHSGPSTWRAILQSLAATISPTQTRSGWSSTGAHRQPYANTCPTSNVSGSLVDNKPVEQEEDQLRENLSSSASMRATNRSDVGSSSERSETCNQKEQIEWQWNWAGLGSQFSDDDNSQPFAKKGQSQNQES